MTLASPPSMMATTELVVPRSMPMIFSSAMSYPFLARTLPGFVCALTHRTPANHQLAGFGENGCRVGLKKHGKQELCRVKTQLALACKLFSHNNLRNPEI